jgi:LacI family transcriptional regulator
LGKVTIREVSKLAGVSNSTVSRVLNKNNPVNPELRERVLKAVKTLSYKPNLAARTLKTRKSHSIYYVVPEIANPYFTEIYSGIQKVTEKRDYVSFLYETVNTQRVIHALIMRGADGIIFDAEYRGDSKEDLDVAGIPYVQTNTPAQYPDKNSVKIDIFKATLDTIAYLKSMGHTVIGLITYKEKDHPIRERYRAFCHYARE